MLRRLGSLIRTNVFLGLGDLILVFHPAQNRASGCLVCTVVRPNFDDDVESATRNFNDIMLLPGVRFLVGWSTRLCAYSYKRTQSTLHFNASAQWFYSRRIKICMHI